MQQWITGGGLAIAVLLLGCGQPEGSAEPQPSSRSALPALITQLTTPTFAIGDLSADQVNQTVQLAGTVTQRVPLLAGMLYQLEDATGTAWVLSRAAAPAVGEQVEVTGVWQYEAIETEGADLSDYYLQEQSRTTPPAEPAAQTL